MNTSYSVVFVKKQVNGVTHELAREALFLPSLYTCYHVISCITFG